MSIRLDGNLGVSATGNISTAQYFIGNGAFITGITATVGNASSIANGTSNIAFTGINGNAVITVNAIPAITVTPVSSDFTGNINPSANIIYSLGNSTNQWKDLWISNSTIYMNRVPINLQSVALANGVIGNTLAVNGNPVIATNSSPTLGNLTVSGGVGAGSVTANSFTGNAFNWANGTPVISANGNLAVANISATGNVISAGNAIAGNILTSGVVSSVGNITTPANVAGGNLLTSGIMSAAGNATAGNLLTSGIVSAAGNATAGNISTVGLISAGGNITGGNIATAGNVDALHVNTSNIFGNSVSITSTGANSGIALNTQGNGNIMINTAYINGVRDPEQSQDAATKAYVDAVATGLQVKASANVATAVALPTYTYLNGSSGIGATITGSTPGLLSIDSVSLVANQRVLVKDETAGNALVNGIYTVSNPGNVSSAFILTRSSDDDTATEMYSAYTFISSGALNAATSWTCTAKKLSPIIIGVSPITWIQFSGAASYQAGNGLSLSGTTFSVKTDDVTTSIDYYGNVVVKASANLSTPNIGDATFQSLTLIANTTGNISAGNVSTAGNTSVTGNLSAGNISTAGIISATGNITSVGNVKSGNLITTGILSAGDIFVANIVGASITVSGNASASGNSTVTGNIAGGNISTAGIVSATGNITGANISGANILTGGNVSATGNIAGNYFIGNGALLTGIATGNVTRIFNGTSNVTIPTANSNVIVNAGNAAAWVYDTSGNLTLPGNTFQVNYANGNAVTLGGSYSNSVVSAYLASGNDTANIITTGNISGNFFIGNGSLLTGLTGVINGTSNVIIPTANGNINFNVANTKAGLITVNAVALGGLAGNSAQGINTVAIGYHAGYDGQGNAAVAIGAGAGNANQSIEAVAIGPQAGETDQATQAIAIGSGAGLTSQSTLAIAIGYTAGLQAQGESTVAIGYRAGYSTQGNNAIAIGAAGLIAQSEYGIAIGTNAGGLFQGGNAVAVGQSAGQRFQSDSTVAIGANSGALSQGNGAVAIGFGAGANAQGANSIAIGQNAGSNHQPANSIVISAGGDILDALNAGFYVNPVRNDTSNTANVVYFNTSTKELTYAPAASTTSVSNGTSNVIIPNTNGNVKINAGNAAAWNFDTTGNVTTAGNIIVAGNSAVVFTTNPSSLTYGDVPVTNRFYVDPGRTLNYTANGSQAMPYTSVGNAITAINTLITGGNLTPSGTAPVFIVLQNGTTENFTLTKGHVYLAGENGSIHTPIIIQGNVTIDASAGGTVSSNHFAISGVEIIGGLNGKCLNITGISPLNVFLQDVWLTASGTGTGLYQDNTGTASTTHGNGLKVSHNGVGDVYCFNIIKGNAYFTDVETSGATQVAAAQAGTVVTFDSSELDAIGDTICETYGNASLTITNSKLLNGQANSFGVKLNAVANVAGTVTLGQVLLSVPTGTGKAVWLDPNTTPGLSGILAYAGVSFYPSTNTSTTATLIPVPLTTLPGTIANPIFAGNITSTTVGSWNLVDNVSNSLSFDTTGKTGLLKFVTTNGSEGVTLSGEANVAGNLIGGNVSTPGNLVALTGNALANNMSAAGNVDANVVNTTSLTGNTVTFTATGANGAVSLNTGTNGNIIINTAYINGVKDPVQSQDVATKSYVDGVASGLQVKASSNVATTTTLPAYSYNNGTAGVGATITASANGALSIDSVSLVATNRVLVKNEAGANAPYNGIYTVTTAGNATAKFVLTRSTDDDTAADMYSAYTYISSGTTNGSTSWTCTAKSTSPITIGTSNVDWIQFSGATTYTAGNGLALTGTTFSVKTDGVTTSIDTNGNVIVKASANLTTPNIGDATFSSLTLTANTTGNISGGNISITGVASVAGNVTGGNLRTVGLVTATGNVSGGNIVTGGLVTATGNVTAGNVLTGGLISATGNISGNNLSITNDITAANYTGSANISLPTGNLTLGTITTTAVANYSGDGAIAYVNYANTSPAPFVAGLPITITGYADANINGTFTVLSANTNTVLFNSTYFGASVGTGNASQTNRGEVVALGNITTSAYFVGNGSQLTGLPATYNDANVFAYLANSNVIISTTGNITGGNILTSNLITTTSNVQAGNLRTGGQVSATGNITGGNVRTTGVLSASGNVSGNYIIGDGSQLTNLSPSLYAVIPTGYSVNVANATAITVVGDATATFSTGGKIATAGNISAIWSLTNVAYDGPNVRTVLTVGTGLTGNVSGIISTASAPSEIIAGNNVTLTVVGSTLYVNATATAAIPTANIQSANFIAAASSFYGANTSISAVYAELPNKNTMTAGQSIKFVDAFGTLSVNPLVIVPGTATINGTTGNMTVTTNGTCFSLMWNGSTWRVYQS